jgi:hypothetical protein
MLSDLYMELARERQRELVREMQKQHLVDAALAGDGSRIGLTGRTATWLGRSLVTLGRGIQVRYGAEQTGGPVQITSAHTRTLTQSTQISRPDASRAETRVA